MKVQKLGFQDQEDGTLLESEERSVGTSYVSTGAFGNVTYSTSTKLQRHHIVIKAELFELPVSMKVQKLGFQDQEDGTLLESEERSVGTSYVSTGAFGNVTYSTSTKLQRHHIVIKVVLFELPIYCSMIGISRHSVHTFSARTRHTLAPYS